MADSRNTARPIRCAGRTACAARKVKLPAHWFRCILVGFSPTLSFCPLAGLNDPQVAAVKNTRWPNEQAYLPCTDASSEFLEHTAIEASHKCRGISVFAPGSSSRFGSRIHSVCA